MKKSKLLVSIIALLVCSVFILGSCLKETNLSEYNFDFDALMEEPTEDSIKDATPIDESKVTVSSNKDRDEENVILPNEDSKVIESAAYLFNLGKENREKIDYFATYTAGNGHSDVTAGIKVRANMEVRDITIKDGISYYTSTMEVLTKAVEVKSGNNSILAPMLAKVLEYANRTYTPDGKTFYVQNKGERNEDSLNTFPKPESLKFKDGSDIEKYTQEQWYSLKHIKDNYLEISNEDITKDSISSASIEKKNGYYRVNMNINVDTDALKLGEAALNDKAKTDNIKYKSYNVIMDIWNSGALKFYATKYSWAGTMLKKFEGEAENVNYKYYTYKKDEVKVIVKPNDDIINSMIKNAVAV